MRKSAIEIIRNLEDRVARLERVSARGLDKKLQKEIIFMIEQEFEDDLSGMNIKFKAMSKTKAKSGKEYTLYELGNLGYYAITDGKKGYWMISEDKREAEKEMSDLKRNKHAGRYNSQSPQALVELGRRGRDHLNSLIFDFLKAEEDERADRGDENKYVAVDVEDQFEFFLGGYGGYALFYCELEYIDMHTNREGKEKKVFYLPVDERKVKQKDGVFDERSILKNILSRDLSDLEEMDL